MKTGTGYNNSNWSEYAYPVKKFKLFDGVVLTGKKYFLLNFFETKMLNAPKVTIQSILYYLINHKYDTIKQHFHTLKMNFLKLFQISQNLKISWHLQEKFVHAIYCHFLSG